MLIPVLAILKGRFGGTPGITFSSTSALAAFGKRRKSRAGAFLNLIAYLAVACMIVALARPQLGRTLTRVQASGVDIMLCSTCRAPCWRRITPSGTNARAASRRSSR